MYLRAKSLLLSKVKGRECRIPWKYNSGSGEWRQQRRQTGKGIGEKSERPALKEVMVVEERGVNSLELTIKGGVALLRRSEFGREKGQSLPGTLYPLLEDSTDVGLRGISGEGDMGSGMRVNEKSGRG